MGDKWQGVYIRETTPEKERKLYSTSVNKKQIVHDAHEIDLILRPYEIFCNPDEEEKIKKTFPFVNNYKITPSPCVELGKAYVYNRREVENAFLNSSVEIKIKED